MNVDLKVLPHISWFKGKVKAVDNGYKDGPCLIWQGAVTGRGGYGTAAWRYNGTRYQMQAHIAYYLATQRLHIPEGYDLDHLCRVKTCLLHTEVVTAQVNQQRRADAKKESGQ